MGRGRKGSGGIEWHSKFKCLIPGAGGVKIDLYYTDVKESLAVSRSVQTSAAVSKLSPRV